MEKTGHQTRTTRTYIPISEISIDMNRECARFARSIIFRLIIHLKGRASAPLPVFGKITRIALIERAKLSSYYL